MSSRPTRQRITEPGEGKMAEARRFVGDHAITSVAFCFGLGFGLGILLGSMVHETPEYDRSTMERFRRQLMDVFSHIVPKS